MARYRVTIVGRNYDAMADLVRRHRIAVVRQTAKAIPGGGYSVQAFVGPDELQTVEAAGYQVDRHEDVDAVGLHRQNEVREARTRRGVLARTPTNYLDVTEVEAALAAAAAPPNDAFTRLIAVPHRTWEGRMCHAIKIGHGAGRDRIGIYFLGGVHAREWGSPDILIHFVEQLATAYRTNTGLKMGEKQFTAAQIRGIVNEKDVYVFPQANPDGRHYSMTVDASWRKNRRPASGSGPAAGCVGVDINRNYDFLWNYLKYFDPHAPIANSTDPCNYEVYIGPSPTSEPETKNIVWLFDEHPGIRYFVDIHSYGELILYNWGDDQDQTESPTMNFRNAAYDGKRGRADDTAYREYIPPADREVAVAVAKKMQAAIKAVRGRAYRVEQAMSLYPTAGTSDDYAFSRHLVDPHASKVYGFTIEWGSESNPTPFHPAYDEMGRIIQEVTAGLLEFSQQAGS